MAYVDGIGFETGGADECSSVTGSPAFVDYAHYPGSSDVHYDGFTDSGGDWADEANIYSGDTSYATGTVPAGGTTGYLILDVISGFQHYNAISILFAVGSTASTYDLDVYVDGAWEPLASGQAITTVTERFPFSSRNGTVTQVRVRVSGSNTQIARVTSMALYCQPNTGNYCMHCDASGTPIYVVVPGSIVTQITLYLYIESLPNSDTIIVGTTSTSNLVLTTTGEIDLYGGVSKAADGTTQLNTGRWYRISASVALGGNNTVYIDGSIEHNAVSAGTNYGSGPQLGVCTSSVTADLYFDDIVYTTTNSSTDLGNLRVFGARPTANGYYQDFGSGQWQQYTGSSKGSGNPVYTDVDNDPPDTTNGAWEEADGTPADFYSLAMENCGSGNLADIGASDTIEAVKSMILFATEAGGAYQDYYLVRYNTVESDGLDTSLDDPKDPTWASYLDLTVPNTSTSWTQTNCNGVEVGGRCQDSGKDMFIYEVYAMIIVKVAEGGGPYVRTINDDMGISDARTLVRNVIRSFSESMGVSDDKTSVAAVIKQIAESLGLTDAMASIKDSPRTIDDSIGMTDIMSRISTFVRSISETVDISDSVSRTITFYRDVANSIGITDDTTQIRGVLRSMDDDIGITDGMATTLDFVRIVAESMGLTDSFSPLVVFARIVDDSLGITDGMVLDIATSIAESMGMTDVIEGIKGYIRSESDDIGITDAATQLFALIRTLSANIGITDTMSGLLNLYRSVSDSIGISDEVIEELGQLTRVIDDGIGITDSTTSTMTVIRTIAESMGLTDSFSIAMVMLRVVSDSLGITDGMVLNRVTSVADSIGLTDAFSSIMAFIATESDDIGLTDSMSKLLALARIMSDNVGMTDSLSRTIVTYRTIADSLGITDEMSYDAVGDFTRTINDSLGIYDSGIVMDWVGSLTNSVGITDAVTKLLAIIRLVLDSEGITDGTVLDRVMAIADTEGMTDLLSEVVGYFRTHDNTIGMTDAMSKMYTLVRTVSETVGMTDAYSLSWTMIKTISDTVGITDAMSYDTTGAIIRIIGDIIGLTDSTSRLCVALRVISDLIDTTDDVAKMVAVSRIVSDSEGITDGLALSRLISVSDQIGITDSVVRIVDFLRTNDDGIGVLDAVLKISAFMATVDDSMGITDEMLYSYGGLVKAAWAFMIMRQTHN